MFTDMNLIGKLQPVIIILSAIVGLALGILTPFGNVSASLIEPFLMLLLYVLFLCVDLKKIGESFRNIRYTGTAVLINFVLTPVIAYLLGIIFFKDSLDIRIGLLMLLVTPCTDWYLVFTGLAKGNVELNMSILPLNLLLQIVLLPVYILLFMHSEVQMNVVSLVMSIVLVLVIPFAASAVTKLFISKKEKIKTFISDQSDNLQLIFLCLAVICMFASEGENLLDNPWLMARMFIPLICFFITAFVAAQVLGRLQKFSKKDIVALNMTTLARNSPLSLAIAVATFPDKPLISLALVIGPLIELPVLSVFSDALKKWNTLEHESI